SPSPRDQELWSTGTGVMSFRT
ncbi:hypothetical protein V3C99_012053, partial [Haemonchus contortus]